MEIGSKRSLINRGKSKSLSVDSPSRTSSLPRADRLRLGIDLVSMTSSYVRLVANAGDPIKLASLS